MEEDVNSSGRSSRNYGVVRAELIRAGVACVALIGALSLGFKDPKNLGTLALSTCGTAIGAWGGLSQSRPNGVYEERERL